MGPILARADTDGVPCYLETMAVNNLAFYQRREFLVVDDAVQSVCQLRCWTLRRDPGRHGDLAGRRAGPPA
jgi:hypothetical protein